MSVKDAMAAYRRGNVTEAHTYRAIVGHDSWQVPVDAERRPATWTTDGKRIIAAMLEKSAPNGEVHQWMEIPGRHLAKHLPPDADGVGFELALPHALIVCTKESQDLLRLWASTLDVEEALDEPYDDQIDWFIEHDWLVLYDGDAAAVIYDVTQRIVHVFSAPDRLQSLQEREPSLERYEVRRVQGKELWAHLAARADYDGVSINRDKRGFNAQSPAVILGFAAGEDLRAEAMVLQARTVAEIHLFLDQRQVRHDTREHALVYRDDRLVAQYSGIGPDNVVVTYDFEPVSTSGDGSHLGDGPTQILCAAQLADVLRRRFFHLPSIALLSTARHRELAAEAATWAIELEKVVDPTIGLIPRRAMRSMGGAWMARQNPEILTAEWIRNARRRAESLAGNK